MNMIRPIENEQRISQLRAAVAVLEHEINTMLPRLPDPEIADQVALEHIAMRRASGWDFNKCCEEVWRCMAKQGMPREPINDWDELVTMLAIVWRTTPTACGAIE